MATSFLGIRRKSKYVPPSPRVSQEHDMITQAAQKVVVVSSAYQSVPLPLSPSQPRKVRAVLCGQHPAKVKAVVALANLSPELVIIAGVADLLDARIVLQSLTQTPDVFICGAYFETEAAQEIADAVGNDLQFIKVPDGLMMQGGGPPAVIDYIRSQVREKFPEGGQAPI